MLEVGRRAPKARKVYNLDADGNRIPAKQEGRWKTHSENIVDWDDRDVECQIRQQVEIRQI